MSTSQSSIKPTLGEQINDLYGRVAKLNDQIAALLAPKWGAQMGILPEVHPLHPGPGPAATDTTPEAADTHGLNVQQADALWDAVAIPGPEQPTFMKQYERVCRTVATLLRERPFQQVQGRCTACRGHSLFLGEGGHVTCSRLDCPNPSAADQLLHGEQAAPAATEATDGTVCANYQPPTAPEHSGLCASCGMSDWKHHAPAGLREQITALRDDLRDTTGARWIADAIDKILDQTKEQPDA